METDDRRPTFLLGVGCQKGGTAWLHRYLAESPQSDLGFRKEYHVWDVLDSESMVHFRTRLGRRTQRIGGRIERGEGADVDTLRLATFYADPDAYFDYFELLLSRDGIRLTADITPAYARLSATRLEQIRDGFARRGIRVAPVFLMREPAERIWSAVRMYQQRTPHLFPGASEDWVAQVYAEPRFEIPTRYEQTMSAVEQVFGRDGVCYALYEKLFDVATVRRICDFLGIDAHPPDFERRVNESPKDRTCRLPESTSLRIAEHYRTTGAAVADRLGADTVAEAWPSRSLVE